MGVPAFFRWLCKKYPSIVVQAFEEKPKKDPNTEEKLPINKAEANPNGVEFDNLYLDMNGIIHPCKTVKTFKIIKINLITIIKVHIQKTDQRQKMKMK